MHFHDPYTTIFLFWILMLHILVSLFSADILMTKKHVIRSNNLKIDLSRFSESLKIDDSENHLTIQKKLLKYMSTV